MYPISLVHNSWPLWQAGIISFYTHLPVPNSKRSFTGFWKWKYFWLVVEKGSNAARSGGVQDDMVLVPGDIPGNPSLWFNLDWSWWIWLTKDQQKILWLSWWILRSGTFSVWNIDEDIWKKASDYNACTVSLANIYVFLSRHLQCWSIGGSKIQAWAVQATCTVQTGLVTRDPRVLLQAKLDPVKLLTAKEILLCSSCSMLSYCTNRNCFNVGTCHTDLEGKHVFVVISQLRNSSARVYPDRRRRSTKLSFRYPSCGNKTLVP